MRTYPNNQQIQTGNIQRKLTNTSNDQQQPNNIKQSIKISHLSKRKSIFTDKDRIKIFKTFKKNQQLKKNKQIKLSMKQKIKQLEEKVVKLEEQLKVLKLQKNQNYFSMNLQPKMFQVCNPSEITPSETNQLQFEKLDFKTLLDVSSDVEIDSKSWVFLGTLMIVIGSQSIEYDGSINVFKVVKEASDQIRRQVEKSQDKITLQFFNIKEQISESSQFDLVDPFFQPYQEPKGGFELQAIRLESIEQSNLTFTQKISYTVKYDALIKGLQYMKANSWFCRQIC